MSYVNFGFRLKPNTTLATVYLVSDLLRSFHDKTYSVCLFLGLRMAFIQLIMMLCRQSCQLVVFVDTLARWLFVIYPQVISLYSSFVFTDVMFTKLQARGVRGYACLRITVDVPHGSVLGTFFLIYL